VISRSGAQTPAANSSRSYCVAATRELRRCQRAVLSEARADRPDDECEDAGESHGAKCRRERRQNSSGQQNGLIVDDHPSFRAVAILALETEGFTVIGAVADGESAVTEARRRQPDIVLLDVGLPDMTGFEAASQLHNAAPCATILLTSSRERSYFGPLIVDSSADGFIQKEQLSGDRLRTEIALFTGKATH